MSFLAVLAPRGFFALFVAMFLAVFVAPANTNARAHNHRLRLLHELLVRLSSKTTPCGLWVPAFAGTTAEGRATDCSPTTQLLVRKNFVRQIVHHHRAIKVV